MSKRKRLGQEFRALTEEVARLRWDNAQLREENRHRWLNWRSAGGRTPRTPPTPPQRIRRQPRIVRPDPALEKAPEGNLGTRGINESSHPRSESRKRFP